MYICGEGGEGGGAGIRKPKHEPYYSTVSRI